MHFLRALARLFLVLALLAGGTAPGAASPADGGEDTAMSAPCHDQAGDPVEPAPADCCGDGACTCDCLHHAPAGFLPAALPPRLAVLGVNQDRPAAVLPLAGAAPEIRPPIA